MSAPTAGRMRLIAGSGAEEPDGLKVVCCSCHNTFDARGGVVFASGPAGDKSGLCADCANEAIAVATRESG